MAPFLTRLRCNAAYWRTWGVHRCPACRLRRLEPPSGWNRMPLDLEVELRDWLRSVRPDDFKESNR